ncbi:Transducin/WD40 repeat-like superfamily protein [Hibiscus syriacus]|uniref:Transducin/WD40 repeat-like superfamily protein n=1 Tax=Hibiscus syriacus TaxID=106335 RepID=A0A6A2X7Q8_HIBSY|nr:protein SRC2 homolog [Hibiscus syriacus]KAE8671311.1 Transducin/WD40 repeat-like superfamily protein [Hibiscus syriacus]
MDVFVVVKITGDTTTEKITPLHKDGGTSPKWNHPMLFTINGTLVQTNTPLITSWLVCCRTFRGDKEIGETQIPIKDLLDSAGRGSPAKYTTYPVKKPSAR